MKIDIHVHLAGVGTGGSGCWIAPGFQRRPVFRYLRWRFGITEEQVRTSIDQDWVARIAELVRGSELDAAVVLGFDGAYGADGLLDQQRSQMVVPPAWVFEACRRHAGLLPGPSVNPLRRDAMDRLEECIDEGAVLIKWLPSAQGIDPSDPGLASFYRRAAEAGVPLLIHSGGGEQTFRELDPTLADVRHLQAPLEAGVTVICAHSGAPVVLSRRPDQTPLLRQMLERFPGLWVDNSGMANPSRFPSLARFARDDLFVERTLYGTDYPIPVNAVYYLRQLGTRRTLALEREPNPFQRDVELKRALGYPDDTLERATRVLPHLRRWLRLAAIMAGALSTTTVAGAQLRPLEPLAWEVFEPRQSFSAGAGVGVHLDQRASLAGISGRLVELGNVHMTWRSGRIAVEGSGTVRRFLDPDTRFAPPAGGARPGERRRSDSGDYRFATAVLLTPPALSDRSLVVARFGTRLPTTDNRVGLERDQTDFFGLVGARAKEGRVSVEAETGIGIYGTRDLNFEQSDLWLYSLSTRYHHRGFTPLVSLLGQMDWSAGNPVRSNEDLAELRVGFTLGRRSWLRAELVKGLATFSPSAGIIVTGGVRR